MELRQKLKEAISYARFRELTQELLAKGQTTTKEAPESYVKYTELNEHRMDRIEKTIQLDKKTQEFLTSWQRPITFLTLTEAWCGDSAQNLPMIEKISEANENLQHKILLRDEHPDLMALYLTNGGKSIPKVILVDDITFQELGTWGPRPQPVQEMLMEHKQNPGEVYADFSRKAQLWYRTDKSQTLQREWLSLLEKINN